MSSIQENATVPLDVVDKRKANFSRIDSFDKLHYTAFYAIQLAGTLLSQKSMLQIMDMLQYKSRVCLHSSIMLMLWPTFEAMCAIFLCSIDPIARYLGFNARHEKQIVSSTNVQKEETYTLRLKGRKEADGSAKTEANLAENEANDESIAEPVDRLKTIDEINVITQRAAFTNRLKSISDSEESISPRQSIGLVVIVYGSATLVYIQLMFLAAFLQTVATPPGLLFLVISLAFIGYIVFKMCFVKSKAKDDANASKSQRNSSPTKSAIADDISPLKKPSRMGRSYTRRFLYFHNKTLSKIKLL